MSGPSEFGTFLDLPKETKFQLVEKLIAQILFVLLVIAACIL